MPGPTCCKLHAHNYTYIPILLGRRGTLNPTGQLVPTKLLHLSTKSYAKYRNENTVIPLIYACH